MATKSPSEIYSTPMEDGYNPSNVEAGWDSRWDGLGLYQPTEPKDGEEPFVMVLPPPNVTGSLHLGHALTVAIQDAVTRWHRMHGRSALWVPGLDHAGIATQVVVEKQLKRTTGQTRHELGREKFVEKVWEWKEDYGHKILQQLRSLGTSLDWTRLRFTLDEMCVKAVLEAFVQFHSTGTIYRDNRLVSWSCALKSAISSIEVDHHEIPGATMVNVPGYDKQVEIGVIHSFSYQVKGSDEKITVATTRIETMLGDVAVAVNSKDERYLHLQGKELIHPFIPDRIVKVITDDALVDMNFGTGAVKITPAHDPNDYACGTRNGLEFINILDDEGKMNQNAGKYQGMHRFAVREQIVKDLEALGLYVGKDNNPMSVGFCSRSQDIVEPLIKPQWWVACQRMADRALKSAQDGELNILPASQNTQWHGWLANTQDWCISRQLWWGHRIPAYYALPKGQTWPVETEDKNRWVIAHTQDAAQLKANDLFPGEEFTLYQDEDVLDTWFSSGLFPFSVMGWPDKTPDFDKFFPGSLLETGSDILFFWVARMVMMSQELTGKLPFNTVYLHSLVRDRSGRKMSKSLGNVIDPLDVINGVTLEALLDKLKGSNLSPAEVEKAASHQSTEFPEGIATCGADALRFGLLSYTKQGSDINLDINVIVSARHFCNKLWQATRFALMSFTEDFNVPLNGFADVKASMEAAGGISFEEEWVLNRLSKVIQATQEAYEKYEFGLATQLLQNFFVDDLCSRYLEFIKQQVKKTGTLYNPERAQSLLSVLYYCLDSFLRLLHPMMPFVTEELFHRLPGHKQRAELGTDDRLKTGSIMVQKFPTLEPLLAEVLSKCEPGCEERMVLILSVIDSIRQVKARLQIPPQIRPDAYLECINQNEMQLFNAGAHLISTLGLITSPKAFLPAQKDDYITQGKTVRALINANVTLHLAVSGDKIDFGPELVKNEKKLLESQIESERLRVVIEKTKDNPKVKQEVKDANLLQYTQLVVEMPLLQDNITVYRAIVSKYKYALAKIKELEIANTNNEKAMVKLQELINKAKKPSERQLKELDDLKALYVTLQEQISTFKQQAIDEKPQDEQEQTPE